MPLPYPGMDFVPFDVLTADQLDHIVSNIEALSAGTGFATGAIGTGTLADSAVTNSKIALSKTTDANGWTVYNFGGYKKYTKVFAFNTSIASFGRANQPLGGFPVGTTSARRLTACSYDGGFAGHCTTGVQVNDVYLGSTYNAGALTFSGSIIVEYTE